MDKQKLDILMNTPEISNAERDVFTASRKLSDACKTLMELRKKFGVDDIGLITSNTFEYDLGEGKYFLQVTFEKTED